MYQHDYKRFFCVGCGHSLRAPVYCNNRFCPVCSKARARRIRHRMKFLMKSVRSNPTMTFKLITLHIRNRESLPGMIAHLTKSFRKLRQRPFWKDSVAGGCFVLEITGSPGNWHAHIHIICQAQFIYWEVLLGEWRHIAGAAGIYISKIKSLSIVDYITKYVTKNCIAPEHEEIISDQLKHYRLFNPFGKWFHLMKKMPKKRYNCPCCGRQDWIPDWVLEHYAPDDKAPRPPRPFHKKELHDMARFQPS